MLTASNRTGMRCRNLVNDYCYNICSYAVVIKSNEWSLNDERNGALIQETHIKKSS